MALDESVLRCISGTNPNRLWTYESLYRALPTWTPDSDEGPQLEIQNSFGYCAY